MVYELEKSRKQTNPPTCKVIKASSRLFAYDANRCLTLSISMLAERRMKKGTASGVLHPWNLLEWRMSSFPDAQSHPWTLLGQTSNIAMNHHGNLSFFLILPSQRFQHRMSAWVLGLCPCWFFMFFTLQDLPTLGIALRFGCTCRWLRRHLLLRSQTRAVGFPSTRSCSCLEWYCSWARLDVPLLY